MTTTMEADISDQLRTIADKLQKIVSLPETASFIHCVADAVEIEQAHHRQCADVLARLVKWASWPDEWDTEFWKAMRQAKGLIG